MRRTEKTIKRIDSPDSLLKKRYKPQKTAAFLIDPAEKSPLKSKRTLTFPPLLGVSMKSGTTNSNLKGRVVNKNDLVASVAEGADISKADAAKAVDAVFDSITGSLKSGGEVRLVGFGTFSVANRKASTGRNPRTGEAIQNSSVKAAQV